MASSTWGSSRFRNKYYRERSAVATQNQTFLIPKLNLEMGKWGTFIVIFVITLGLTCGFFNWSWISSFLVSNEVKASLLTAYKEKLLPLEEKYFFHEFHSMALDDAVFEAKPAILLVGQYSTGKTTFIKHLLRNKFEGMRIGPEPTTDGFTYVMYGDQDKITPGYVCASTPNLPFGELKRFGNKFLNRFQCSHSSSETLKGFSIIDTPGILSAEEQRLKRGYDFPEVLRWFGEYVDRILLFFDVNKLDISDEFKRSLEALSGQEDKFKIVLNKVDMITSQELVNVYGSLQYSLSKVIQAPEIPRIYTVSLWDDKTFKDISTKDRLVSEEKELLDDLKGLLENGVVRKLNDLIKRARLAKAHSLIIGTLAGKMSWFSKDLKKEELIADLQAEYVEIQREHKISEGDFPDLEKMKKQLKSYDFSKFPSLDMNLISKVDELLAENFRTFLEMTEENETRNEL